MRLETYLRALRAHVARASAQHAEPRGTSSHYYYIILLKMKQRFSFHPAMKKAAVAVSAIATTCIVLVAYHTLSKYGLLGTMRFIWEGGKFS